MKKILNYNISGALNRVRVSENFVAQISLGMFHVVLTDEISFSQGHSHICVGPLPVILTGHSSIVSSHWI